MSNVEVGSNPSEGIVVVEINRNQYFMVGLVLLFLGIQFRAVDTFVLNEQSTQFMTKRFGTPAQKTISAPFLMVGAPHVGPRKVVRPPDWIGWALISIGAVLILHSLAMKRPDG